MCMRESILGNGQETHMFLFKKKNLEKNEPTKTIQHKKTVTIETKMKIFQSALRALVSIPLFYRICSIVIHIWFSRTMIISGFFLYFVYRCFEFFVKLCLFVFFITKLKRDAFRVAALWSFELPKAMQFFVISLFFALFVYITFFFLVYFY